MKIIYKVTIIRANGEVRIIEKPFCGSLNVFEKHGSTFIVKSTPFGNTQKIKAGSHDTIEVEKRWF